VTIFIEEWDSESEILNVYKTRVRKHQYYIIHSDKLCLCLNNHDLTMTSNNQLHKHVQYFIRNILNLHFYFVRSIQKLVIVKLLGTTYSGTAIFIHLKKPSSTMDAQGSKRYNSFITNFITSFVISLARLFT